MRPSSRIKDFQIRKVAKEREDLAGRKNLPFVGITDEKKEKKQNVFFFFCWGGGGVGGLQAAAILDLEEVAGLGEA